MRFVKSVLMQNLHKFDLLSFLLTFLHEERKENVEFSYKKLYSQRIFQGPNYKCLTRETRQGDLRLFFHADSENQIFKNFYHSV